MCDARVWRVSATNTIMRFVFLFFFLYCCSFTFLFQCALGLSLSERVKANFVTPYVHERVRWNQLLMTSGVYRCARFQRWVTFSMFFLPPACSMYFFFLTVFLSLFVTFTTFFHPYTHFLVNSKANAELCDACRPDVGGGWVCVKKLATTAAEPFSYWKKISSPNSETPFALCRPHLQNFAVGVFVFVS